MFHLTPQKRIKVWLFVDVLIRVGGSEVDVTIYILLMALLQNEE